MIYQAQSLRNGVVCDEVVYLQLSEMDIIEKVEKLTDPDQPEGEWITKIDLVEKVPLPPISCAR